MSKKVDFSKEAREKIVNGLNIVANAVKATLGPGGRLSVIETDTSPLVTKDGVTVARSISLKGSENQGAKLLIEASSKTNAQVGDSTTTTCVLAQSIVNEGIKHISFGENPVLLKKSIDKAVKDVVNFIRSKSIPINSKEQIKFVAEIAGNDETVGKNISDAIDKVGNDGVVTLENSKASETYVEFTEGIQFNRGWMSAYFCTNLASLTAEYENPVYFLTDKKITNTRQYGSILEKIAQEKRPVVVICEDMDADPLAVSVKNKVDGGFPIVVIKAPGYGAKVTELLQDIAVAVGAKVISQSFGLGLDDFNNSMLGSSNKIVVGYETTTIFEGSGTEEELQNRIEYLKSTIEQSENPYEVEQTKERLAKLAGGIGVIKVGARTEVEQVELRHRYEDSLNATKAAIKKGIIPGGGYTLLKAAQELDSNELGYKIVKTALCEPIRAISENSGADPNDVVRNVLEKDLGYDALTGTYCDLVESGIVDPAQATISALENAASIAGLILLTETLITSENQQENKQ